MEVDLRSSKMGDTLAKHTRPHNIGSDFCLDDEAVDKDLLTNNSPHNLQDQSVIRDNNNSTKETGNYN